MKFKSIIASFLLLSYFLVLTHGIVPHQHGEIHPDAGIHHHYDDPHQDYDWVHFLDHLLIDIVNIDQGQSHLNYFKKSGFSKSFKLYKSANLSPALDFQVTTKQLQPTVGSPRYFNARFNYHIFLISQSKRGPPLAV